MQWTAVLGLLLLLASRQALPAPLAGPTAARHKLLLVSFDGFRWDYDRDVDTPNMDAMARDGVKARYVTPPYLTITSPSHFTLLTGLYIENHGVIHNMWFNSSTGQKKPYYQTQFVNEWWDTGSLPIWITAQRQGLKAGSLHFPGTSSRYRGDMVMVRDVEPPLYDYKNETLWRANADKVMGWFKDLELDFVSMYFGEPDSTGHRYGPDSPERRAMVRQVDRTVGYIRASAGRHNLTDRLNIIITSDHGMSSVYRNGAVQEITLYKIPGFSFRDLSFHLLDFGPSGMLLPRPGRLEKVYNALKGAHPHLHVYRKEEMPARMHFARHERILPIVLWADPGYVINGYFPVQVHKGEHGFDNAELDMKAFFRAVGPAFHRDLEVAPFETVNVYALMCHILGIRPEANDGHLDATRHMLASSPTTPTPDVSGDRSDQQTASIGLSAVVGFLFLVFVVAVATGIRKNGESSNMQGLARLTCPAEKDDMKQTAL